MIISHHRRFIFLKTRKTAGSSIQIALTSACGADDIVIGNDSHRTGLDCDRNVDRAFTRNGHASLGQLKFALPAATWASYFKMVFVRNPWDLAVSRYHWEKKGLACDVADFRDWLADYTSPDWLEPPRNAQANIVQRVWETGSGYAHDLQSPFALEDGKLAVDFLGRYEQLEADFVAACRKLDIEPPPLPRLKSGFRSIGGYRDAYDDTGRRRIERAFAADIDAFEYRF